ncbi:MAG TPA: ATP-dependent Clp protease adapter ClpS [bacterium]|nr:ATP-dependent Clp protease adapter ClpS [bacterium]
MDQRHIPADDVGYAPEEELLEQALEPPPMFRVLLLNDDFTPMEFVILVLERVFRHPHERAVQIMLDVHQKGRGVCGVYSREVAETKVALVVEWARENDYPLLAVSEPVDR